ncbi:hypothetical protein B0H17DRAFT_1123684 [Mycena rosella]|uniref:Uncharacterized protein n=1 Tax=Mycena rosella TaxID=1033263 RepID=A0AAD7H2N8_MYCRO|nr:hypothetical protein B0H17DRAFT_1123684 [Mycena rosella]
MLDDSKLVKYFPVLPTALKKRIKSLPSSLPLGDTDRYLLGTWRWMPKKGRPFRQITSGSASSKVQDGIKGTVNVEMLACRIHGLNSLLDSILPSQLYAIHFPILSRIVREILCIPGVSIAVE